MLEGDLLPSVLRAHCVCAVCRLVRAKRVLQQIARTE